MNSLKIGSYTNKRHRLQNCFRERKKTAIDRKQGSSYNCTKCYKIRIRERLRQSVSLIIRIKYNLKNKFIFKRYEEKVHYFTVFFIYRINRAGFIVLQTLIIKLFPRESPQIYYIPAFKSQVARGKLYSAYTYYRRQLGAVGLIEIRVKLNASSCSTSSPAPEIIEETTETEETVSDDIKNQLNWLEENAGPFETVSEYWKNTRSLRLSILQNVEQTTHNYLCRFPALDTIDGYKLV